EGMNGELSTAKKPAVVSSPFGEAVRSEVEISAPITTEKASTSDTIDDSFSDIMSIFNRK
ncbi:MAG: hypothetical protein R3Y33_01535, partial [Clostridia bacterium]